MTHANRDEAISTHCENKGRIDGKLKKKNAQEDVPCDDDKIFSWTESI